MNCCPSTNGGAWEAFDERLRAFGAAPSSVKAFRRGADRGIDAGANAERRRLIAAAVAVELAAVLTNCENLVASQLLKYCHFVEDTEGHALELRYLRDTDGREVDFVVLRNRKPLFAVECKSGEKAAESPSFPSSDGVRISAFRRRPRERS